MPTLNSDHKATLWQVAFTAAVALIQAAALIWWLYSINASGFLPIDTDPIAARGLLVGALTALGLVLIRSTARGVRDLHRAWRRERQLRADAAALTVTAEKILRSNGGRR